MNKFDVLKDTTWKLKTFECSSVISFENLSRIVSLCGFQNRWNFSVFVTISIHSWLLFTLIACWLAIYEEVSLKSIILIILNRIPWISLSQVKLSNQVQRCMNWKDLPPIKKIVLAFKKNLNVSGFLISVSV
jgi:hypothetical protein